MPPERSPIIRKPRLPAGVRQSISHARQAVNTVTAAATAPTPAAATAILNTSPYAGISTATAPTGATHVTHYFGTPLASVPTLNAFLSNPSRYLPDAATLRKKYLSGALKAPPTAKSQATPKPRRTSRSSPVQALLTGRRTLPGLTPSQTKVAAKSLGIGLRKGATPKELLADLETGIVESNLQNLRYGTSDSQGYRQERTSLYGTKHADSVRLSSRDFFKETAAAGRGKGMTAGQLAQTVQGSAYPARYDEHAGQAKQILSAFLKGGGGGPYVYPFDPKQVAVGRIDQGQDFSGSGPIRAIGRAKYLGPGQGAAWASGGGGGSGQGLLYRLTKGPAKGRIIYVYEGVSTKPGLQPGQTLHKGQVIGKVLPAPNSLEIGFADASGTPTSHTSYSEGVPTKGGAQFAKFAGSIKKNGGVLIGHGGVGNIPAGTAVYTSAGQYVGTAGQTTGAPGQTAPQRKQRKPRGAQAGSPLDALAAALSMAPKPGGLSGTPLNQPGQDGQQGQPSDSPIPALYIPRRRIA